MRSVIFIQRFISTVTKSMGKTKEIRNSNICNLCFNFFSEYLFVIARSHMAVLQSRRLIPRRPCRQSMIYLDNFSAVKCLINKAHLTSKLNISSLLNTVRSKIAWNRKYQSNTVFNTKKQIFAIFRL